MSTWTPERVGGTREFVQLQEQIDEMRQVVDRALGLLKDQIETTLADVPDRVSRLEQIIEPLRLTADDVATGVEVRMRETDGRWRPIAAADIAGAILAGKRVVKMVPQVIA